MIIKYYVTKRNNGYYYLISVSKNNKRSWKSLKTKDSVVADSIKKNLENKGKIIFKDFDFIIDFWNTLKKSMPVTTRESTLKLYEHTLSILRKVIGDMPAHDINSITVDTFKRIRAKQVSGETLNIELRTLKTIFNRAMTLKLVGKNPFNSVKLKYSTNKTPIFITENDFNNLTRKIDNTVLTNLYTFGFYTGAKLSEIINLKWTDIQLEKYLITINERVIPISFRLLEVLTQMNEEPKTEYVFTKNSKIFLSNYISHHFKDLVKKSDQNKDLHFNSLRHSFIMHCIIHGVDLFTTKEMVGLSDFTVFEKIYVNVTNEHKLKQIEKFKSDTIEFGLNDLHENKNVINKQNQK